MYSIYTKSPCQGKEQIKQKSTVKHSFVLSSLLIILIATTVFALGPNITGNVIDNLTNNNSNNIGDDVVNDVTDTENVNHSFSVPSFEVINESGSEDVLTGNGTSPNATDSEVGGVEATLPENGTSTNISKENVTLPEDNVEEIVENETVEITEPQIPEEVVSNETSEERTEDEGEGVPGIPIQEILPELDVELIVPQKVTRGDVVSLQTVVRNVGSVGAENVVIRWYLPDYLISTDDVFKGCGAIDVGENCEHMIEVVVTKNVELGANEVKVFVEYE